MLQKDYYIEPYIYTEILSGKMLFVLLIILKMEFHIIPLNLEFNEKIKQNLMFLETGKKVEF